MHDETNPVTKMYDYVNDMTHILIFITDADKVIVMDDDWMDKIKAENAQYPAITEPPGVSLDSMAYTVYSSGTTGKPKGEPLILKKFTNVFLNTSIE